MLNLSKVCKKTEEINALLTAIAVIKDNDAYIASESDADDPYVLGIYGKLSTHLVEYLTGMVEELTNSFAEGVYDNEEDKK